MKQLTDLDFHINLLLLGHLDLYLLGRLIVSAGVTLMVTIHWQVMGALVSVVTATVLAHIEASSQPPARLVYLPSNDCLDPDKLNLSKVIEDILSNCSRKEWCPHEI